MGCGCCHTSTGPTPDGLSMPVGSVIFDHFGWLGGFFSLDVPASSTLTQQQLGWQPTQSGLLADLEQGHYFAERAA